MSDIQSVFLEPNGQVKTLQPKQIYWFRIENKIKTLHFSINAQITNSDTYKQMRYNAKWYLQYLLTDSELAKIDSKIHNEYLKIQDQTVIDKYQQMFSKLEKENPGNAELTLLACIQSQCDSDTQQMLFHCSALPDGVKKALKFAPKFTMPILLDESFDGLLFLQQTILFETWCGFEPAYDSSFSFLLLQETFLTVYPHYIRPYNSFVRSPIGCGLGSGKYVLIDQCMYAFSDLDNLCIEIEYILESQVIKQEHRRTLYVQSPNKTSAKKVGPGVYRFDFLPCESNRYLITKDLIDKDKSIDLQWRTSANIKYSNGCCQVKAN